MFLESRMAEWQLYHVARHVRVCVSGPYPTKQCWHNMNFIIFGTIIVGDIENIDKQVKIKFILLLVNDSEFRPGI